MKATDLLFLLAIMAIFAFFVYRYGKFETFCDASHRITFMTASDTSDALLGDADAYVKNMSPLDLYARRMKTHTQYLRAISEAAIDISQPQRDMLIQAAHKADAALRNQEELPMADKLAWVFAMTKGSVYEDGMPHTRTNIIFLPDDITSLTMDELTRTLIHEKVHIYQRMYPEHMMKCLEDMGYRRWKQRLGEPRIRANPDVDPWIYIDPDTRTPMVAYYSSDTPYGITDVILKSPSFEHPYEKMAYDIAERLTREKTLKKFLYM